MTLSLGKEPQGKLRPCSRVFMKETSISSHLAEHRGRVFGTASFVQLLILQTCKVEQNEFEHYRSSSALEEPSIFNLEMCLTSQGFIYSPF